MSPAERAAAFDVSLKSYQMSILDFKRLFFLQKLALEAYDRAKEQGQIAAEAQRQREKFIAEAKAFELAAKNNRPASKEDQANDSGYETPQRSGQKAKKRKMDTNDDKKGEDKTNDNGNGTSGPGRGRGRPLHALPHHRHHQPGKKLNRNSTEFRLQNQIEIPF